MKTTTLRKGEGLSDLVNRLYASGVDKKAAEKRLLEANPQLRRLDKGREGILVLIPEVEGSQFKKGEGKSNPEVNEVLESLVGLLEAARVGFERSSQEQEEDLKASKQALNGKAFKEAVRRTPKLEEKLPGLKTRLKDRSKTIDEFQEAHRSILDDLDKDLRTLIEVVKLGPKPKVPVPARSAEGKAEEPSKRTRTRPERIAYHVTYDKGEGRWRILEAGNPQPLSQHDTKKEAVNAGRKIAQDNQPSQIFIHKQDGEIQEERTYSDDPPETKG